MNDIKANKAAVLVKINLN